MNENELSNVIIRLAMKIHTKLGVGLLESVYQECLRYELSKEGFRIDKEDLIRLFTRSLN